MKVFRNIIYVIIAIFLGIFINLLSLSFILKDVVQGEIISNTIKTSIVSGYLANNIDNLTDDQKELIEDFLKDNEINEVVDSFIDGYLNNQGNEKYRVSQEDVDKLKNYIEKHQEIIKQISNKDIDINDITKEITVDNINSKFDEVYDKLDNNTSQVQPVINSYKYFTVGPAKVILIVLIIVCIILLVLISWSLIKWMKTVGICLVSNGVIILFMFVVADALKDFIIKSSNLNITFSNFTFTNILMVGAIELLVGILLIVAYKLLNNKYVSKTKEDIVIENKQDDNKIEESISK